MEATRRLERWEMGLEAAEFLRLLPMAVGKAPPERGSSAASGRDGPVAWRLSWRERPPRRVAALEIPVLEVVLELEGGSPAQASAFVERFLRGYQRAGG